MTYAGTNKGGTSAILAAEGLVKLQLAAAAGPDLTTAQVRARFGSTLDRLMGEAGLWDAETAAAAFIQARGDLPEAVHLLRAHRSTLPRLGFSVPVDPDDIELLRRIVPAHRSPDGPQLLGETVDYTARLLQRPGDPDPLPPTEDLIQAGAAEERQYDDVPPARYSSYLESKDLLTKRHDDTDPEPVDLALNPIQLPAERSALLSAMAMAETGGLVSLWYRSILGPDGYADESITLGEVRHGRVRVSVVHPHTGQPVGVGSLRISECEAVTHLDERGEDPARFDVGYGLALGHNERKAIAMATMDLAAHRHRATPAGSELQQLIMHTTDGLASNGFLEHLKLPHYVTFRSMVDRAEAARDEDGHAATRPTPEIQPQWRRM